MADSLFDTLQSQAYKAGITPRSKESMAWFRKKLKSMTDINRQRLLRDPAVSKQSTPKPGDMYMFFYDAKHKAKLPYYDQFPLIILADDAKGGFYGLNVHYLPLTLRAKFFDSLLETVSDKRYNEQTRFRARYKALKSVQKLKYFKPCFKHYLSSQVQSGIVKVEPSEWEIAMFMPVQQFKGASDRQVWKDSKDMIG